MRNKRVILFAVLVALLIAPQLVRSEAIQTSARNARTGSISNGINQVVGIGELRGGDTWEIQNTGAGLTREYPLTIATVQGTDADATGAAARVHFVNVAGSTMAAGEYVNIYDAASATGTPKLEISIGTAKESRSVVIPGGLTFSTGVFVDQSANNMLVTIGYEN